GVSGHVVDGTSVASVAAAVGGLLADPAAARRMGEAGREWVQREWRWDVLAQRLRDLLADSPPDLSQR
ncbi:MAG: glycosyltransferase, partial [Pseudorhodobacter sp.]|nr:glycosyltransferase [Frankiaceae bacterium]